MLRGHRFCGASAEKLLSLGRGGPTVRIGALRAFTGLVQEKHPSAATGVAATSASSPKATSLTASNGTVLGSAAEEAQRLSELAAQCRLEPDSHKVIAASTITQPSASLTTTTTRTSETSSSSSLFQQQQEATTVKPVDEKTLQSALDGAQKLLFVTTKSSPLQDAIQNKQSADPDIQRQIACLHRAFLAVTSWCLDVVDRLPAGQGTDSSAGDPRMLEKALEVARRAHQLQLPFHLPLYQRIMVSIAKHHDPPKQKQYTTTAKSTVHRRPKFLKNQVRSPGGLILEIAERASVSLGPQAVTASNFFRDALVALAQRRRFHDVLVVLKGMESQFRIGELELDTLAHLLAVLKDQVEQQQQQQQTEEEPSVVDDTDFLEILSMLNPYVWKTMKSYSSLSDMLVQQRSQQRRDAAAAAARDKALTSNDQEPLLPSTPSSPTTNTQSTTKKRDELYYFRGWIYQNDSPTGHKLLPDISEQIEQLYGKGHDFRYSEALERSILRQTMMDDLDDDITVAGDEEDDEYFGIDSDILTDDADTDYFDELSSDDDDDDDRRV